jgi:hypothetical protein
VLLLNSVFLQDNLIPPKRPLLSNTSSQPYVKDRFNEQDMASDSDHSSIDFCDLVVSKQKYILHFINTWLHIAHPNNTPTTHFHIGSKSTVKPQEYYSSIQW